MHTTDAVPTNEMFLIDPSKTWFELISEYWQWILGFFLALGYIYRAGKKTGTTGKSIFTMIRRFTDTATAISELKTEIKTGFSEIKAEQAYLNAKLEVLSDGHITPTFRADIQGNFIDVNEAFCQLFINRSTNSKATAGRRFFRATTASNRLRRGIGR